MKVITFLRYPGGKSKYIKRYLLKYINDTFTEFVEPFAGGSSFTLYLKQLYPNKRFHINDLNYNLFCFWITLQGYAIEMQNEILRLRDLYEINRMQLFQDMKKQINGSNIFYKAVAFYILNKTSFSGLTEQGNFTPLAWDQNFSKQNISKLSQYAHLLENVLITNYDYRDVIRNDNRLYFIDPPYDIKMTLYGKDGILHKGFNHIELANHVNAINPSFIMTYNDGDVKDLYSNYNIETVEFRYYMNHGSDKKTRLKNEVIISNVNARCK